MRLIQLGIFPSEGALTKLYSRVVIHRVERVVGWVCCVDYQQRSCRGSRLSLNAMQCYLYSVDVRTATSTDWLMNVVCYSLLIVKYCV